MKKINVAKRDLVLGAALVIFCLILGMVNVLVADAGCAYTDEEIMNMYIDQVHGEDYSGVLYDEEYDDSVLSKLCPDIEYIHYMVKDPDGNNKWHCTYSKDYMIQRIERGY